MLPLQTSFHSLVHMSGYLPETGSLMQIFLSAILNELASRSLNFLVNKSSKLTVPDVEHRLQRALLRAQTIIDEATGRHITNRAMLQQVDMLRDVMHQGCYMLDTFRYQQSYKEAKNQVRSHSFSLSKLNFLKGIRSSNRNTILLQQLEYALDNLSSMILDTKELVVFLMSYPHMYRQPYSMHLLLGNCMFNRQIETELVINFLLDTQPHGSGKLEVLPIVGPAKVGKSTLLGHVCKSERVRDHFSKILFLRDQDLIDDDITVLRKGYVKKHQNRISDLNKDMPWLVVVDLVGDLSDDAWNMLYSSGKQCLPSTTKIIIASRSAKITKFGTTRALDMKYLSLQAFWYFFKTVAFGSMNPEMHPRFAHVAMEIAKVLGTDHIGLNTVACLLRENFDIQFWCRVLDFLRVLIQKHVSKSGVHPFNLANQNKIVHLGRMSKPSEDLVFYCEYQRSSHEEVPKIRIEDLMYGNVMALGKSEFLGWVSPIPPYYSYIVCCEVRELKRRAAKRKRSTEDRIDLC